MRRISRDGILQTCSPVLFYYQDFAKRRGMVIQLHVLFGSYTCENFQGCYKISYSFDMCRLQQGLPMKEQHH